MSLYKTGTAANHLALLDTLIREAAGFATASAPAFTGTGNGSLLNLDTYPATVTENWTVTCTDATTPGAEVWSVSGSVTGAAADATTGVPYDSGDIQFVIQAGTTAFAVNDAFTFTTTVGGMPTVERWEVLRWQGVDEITYSSQLVDWEAHRAVKGPYHQHSNGWSTAIGQQANSWIALKMVRPYEVLKLGIKAPTSNRDTAPNSFSLEYSNDGATWTTLQSWTGETAWGEDELRIFDITATSPGPRKYWRISVTSNDGDAEYTRIQDIQFLEQAPSVLFDYCRRPAAWMKAPGLTGQDPVFLNFQLYDRPSNDYYNIAVQGTTGFIEDAEFEDQPGALTPMAIPLWSQSIPFWLAINGQRVILGARVDTVYMGAYLGKMLPFGTPGQYPYPLLIGAPLSGATETRYSSTSVGLPYKGGTSRMKLRSTDGSWVQPSALPYSRGLPYRSLLSNSEYALIPVTLYDGGNVYGVLDGINFITGFNNAVENVAQIGAEEHTVLQDGQNNGINDFYTMRTA